MQAVMQAVTAVTLQGARGHRLAPGRGGQLGHRVRGAGPARGDGQAQQVQAVDTQIHPLTTRFSVSIILANVTLFHQ